MYLQRLRATRQKSRQVRAFGGYEHTHRAGADRFYDMQNLASDSYPLLAPRKKRGTLGSLSAPNGLFAKEALCYADGADLYYNGERVGAVSNTPKQFVGMGASILIWPDKLRLDTVSGTLSPLSARCVTAGTVSFAMSNLQAEAYADYTVADMAPAAPEGGELWLDTAELPHTLRRYSASTGLWAAVSAAYIRLSCPGIGVGFRVYDGITISGCAAEALNGSFLLYGADADHLLIAGTLDAAFTQTAPLTLAREIPDFDFLCEHDNRLWGCSNARREIACCKLGDPTNWQCHMGISTDSYTLTVGSDGDFTGCCAFAGCILFFKEDRLLKIMGSKPENFQLSTTLCPGVAAGSHHSLAAAGDTLYYHAPGGVYAYGGGLPERIGAPLGEKFADAVAGALDEKYYISMRTSANVWRFFVYDARYGLWHREDDAQALAFAPLAGELYALIRQEQGAALTALRGSEGAPETDFPWFFETGELCDAGFIRPRKLTLRLHAQPGARLRARLCYDDGPWTEAGFLCATRKRPLTLPLRLRRCDSLRLRVEGTGACTLYGLTLHTETGVDAHG